MVSWIRPAWFYLAKWPGLQRYRSRLRDRPSVKAAMDAEECLLKRG